MGKKMSVKEFNLHRDRILLLYDKGVINVVGSMLLFVFGAATWYLAGTIYPYSVVNFGLVGIGFVCIHFSVMLSNKSDDLKFEILGEVNAFYPKG